MKLIRPIVKVGMAGIVAVAILCCIFSFYSAEPVHIANIKGNTDYTWPANSEWRQMKEGISWGRYDANGYNNLQVVADPDVLILGSSHMEAKNVMQNENTAYFLNSMLAGDYTVYNLGISGHHFTKVCKYLPVTMELYAKEPKIVIIETDTVFFTRGDVEKLVQGKLEVTPSHSSGLIAMLQKLPFFRLVYHQLDGGLLDLLMPEKEQNALPAVTQEKQVDEEAYSTLFAYLHDVMKDYDSQVIIFYHPTEKLQSDGTISFDGNYGAEAFGRKCEEYGITFVNMEASFLEMFDEEHKVPHGFTTGKIGAGHLNADGHRCVAQELAEAIAELEKEGKLCK